MASLPSNLQTSVICMYCGVVLSLKYLMCTPQSKISDIVNHMYEILITVLLKQLMCTPQSKILRER